jgi:hypothetical protein
VKPGQLGELVLDDLDRERGILRLDDLEQAIVRMGLHRAL